MQNKIYKNINNKTIYKRKSRALLDTYNKLNIDCSKNLFVLTFGDDINAKDTQKIRDIVSLILLIANKHDEVLLKLNSSGGFINNYGLAAAQIKRLKGLLKITISIDLVAASGGYLIASVADKIIASNFAIIGSIGVISIVPNFNKLITMSHVDIEYHTAGEYKSTLSVIGKNTENGRKKFISSLNRTHVLFKNYLKINRPVLDIDNLATGEYWYAEDAINLKLIDEIKTSDEYILEKINDTKVYEIKVKKQINFKEKTKNWLKKSFLNLIIK